MGKICSGCHKELAKAKFSGKQWSSNNDDQRRCKQCTANNILSRPIPRPATSKETKAPCKPSYKLPNKEPFEYIDLEQAREKLKTVPDDVSCWICLEEKDLSEGASPLLRDCCCRGDHAGWAHYECLAKYSKQMVEEEFRIFNSGGSILPGMLHVKWITCPNCHQEYTNDLCVAMAAGHVKQIENIKEEWRDPQLHRWLRCEAHLALVGSLKDADNFQGIHLDEIGHLSNMVLKKLIPKIKNNDYVFRQRQLELEADVQEGGLSYYAEMKEDYGTAIELKKRALKILELLKSGVIELSYEADYEAKAALTQEYIEQLTLQKEGKFRITEEKEEDTNDPEVYRLNLEKAKRMERLYELTKRDCGENSVQAIYKGLWYANLLYKVSAVKAQRLITELFETSTRIFGPEHNLSVRARGDYEDITRNRSVMVFRKNFDVVEYDRHNDSYVLTLPESSPDGMEEQHERLKGQQLVKPRYLCALNFLVFLTALCIT